MSNEDSMITTQFMGNADKIIKKYDKCHYNIYHGSQKWIDEEDYTKEVHELHLLIE
jgi:hypothetical protein